MDVYRGQDGSYLVEADLPGAGLDSVEVTVEHVVLTIQAERTSHYGDSVQVIVAEGPRGAFARQLSLPSAGGVDSKNLTAGYADGVRHVTIPTSPKAQARRVEVTPAAGGSRVVPGGTAEPAEAPAGSTGGGRRPNVPVPCHRSCTGFSRLEALIEHNLHTSSPRNPPPRRQNRPICAQRPGPNVETQPANIRRSVARRGMLTATFRVVFGSGSVIRRVDVCLRWRAGQPEHGVQAPGPGATCGRSPGSLGWRGDIGRRAPARGVSPSPGSIGHDLTTGYEGSR